jgi:hypothetical protein
MQVKEERRKCVRRVSEGSSKPVVAAFLNSGFTGVYMMVWYEKGGWYGVHCVSLRFEGVLFLSFSEYFFELRSR